jgi:argininosuccinate lyase
MTRGQGGGRTGREDKGRTVRKASKRSLPPVQSRGRPDYPTPNAQHPTPKLWGGRFEGATDELVERLNNSLAFDVRLWRHDIQGSIAHATMLGEEGIIPPEDAARIAAGLREIEKGLTASELAFDPAAEDVHSAVEALLREKIGPVAGRLHTARSRNDQVATDARLYLRDVMDELDARLRSLQETLIGLAERELGDWVIGSLGGGEVQVPKHPTTQRPNDPTVLPGYTHLQHAQPVLLSHHLLAYFWMFQRDRERLTDARCRVNVLPLGAGALAGTSFPIRRERVAELLGFEGIAENSLDAVSDRDFALEFLADAAILAVHLSRFAEELILWNSPEFGYVELDDSVTTGSSLMPQKKNPDVAELARGKAGRIIGDLTALLSVMKGLPLAYNKDMQEDKEPLFDAADTLLLVLPAFEKMLATAQFRRERMAAALRGDFSTATDLADLLVRRGMPFRDAHHIVGRIVRHCLERNIGLEELDAGTLIAFAPEFGEDAGTAATIQASIAARRARGGTAPEAVREQLQKAKAVVSRESPHSRLTTHDSRPNMTKWWSNLREHLLTGPLFVLVATFLVFAVLHWTGGANSPFLPLITLPVILSIVRCSVEIVVGVGLIITCYYLYLFYNPVSTNHLHTIDAVRALTINAIALIGAFYARRVQREREQLMHTVEEKEALLNASQIVNSADKLEDALNRTLLMLRTIVPSFRCAAIFLTDEAQRQMELQAVLNMDPGELRFERFSLTDENFGWRPEDPDPLYIPDTQEQRGLAVMDLDPGARSLVCIALRSLRVPIGLLFISSEQSGAFNAAQVRMLGAFADRVGFPLQKIRVQESLRGLAFTDGMTGLYNFRSFSARLEEEMKRAARYERPLSLILMDLDGFKGINDRYGHPAGDTMLIGIAATIRGNIRETDVPARYGGEEFAIICPEINSDEAAVVAERVRRAVEAARFQLVPEETCAVTLSLGIASYPQNALDENALVRAADDALYHAKHAGKNRVAIAEVTARIPSESA